MEIFFFLQKLGFYFLFFKLYLFIINEFTLIYHFLLRIRIMRFSQLKYESLIIIKGKREKKGREGKGE